MSASRFAALQQEGSISRTVVPNRETEKEGRRASLPASKLWNLRSTGCTSVVCARDRRSAPRSLTFVAVACLALSLLLPASARSSTFKLVYDYDKRTGLCRAYQKNLAAFPHLSVHTYEWPLDPKLTDFKKPDWQPVDIRQHMDILKTLYEWNYDSSGANEKYGEEVWERASRLIPDQITKRLVRLDVAHLDFDNSGDVDTVYRFFHRMTRDERTAFGGDQPTKGYWYIYFDQKDEVTPKSFRFASDEMFFYDSFLYNGHFYLIRWDDTPKLTIFDPGKNTYQSTMGLLPVCSFRLTK
jgi:hypothetical protein